MGRQLPSSAALGTRRCPTRGGAWRGVTKDAPGAETAAVRWDRRCHRGGAPAWRTGTTGAGAAGERPLVASSRGSVGVHTSGSARPKRASRPAGSRLPGRSRAPHAGEHRNAPYLGPPPPPRSAPAPFARRQSGAASGLSRAAPAGTAAVGDRSLGAGARSSICWSRARPQRRGIGTHLRAALSGAGGAGTAGRRGDETTPRAAWARRAARKGRARAERRWGTMHRREDEASPASARDRQEVHEMGFGGTRPGSGDHITAPGDKEQRAVPGARQRGWSAVEVRGSGGKGRAISAVQSPGIPGQEEGNLRLESCVRLRTLQPRFAIASRWPRSCRSLVCGSPPNERHEFPYRLLCLFGFIIIILCCGIWFLMVFFFIVAYLFSV